MAEWFVYTDTCYYPWAEIVEADTAAEAAALAMPGIHERVVLPLDVRYEDAGTIDAIKARL